MRRDELFGLMADPGLKGMRAAYDEALADGSRRGHSAERILGQLLKAEAVDKRARSIRYQMAGAKLPAAKELDGFVFADGAVDESRARARGRLVPRARAQRGAHRRHGNGQDAPVRGDRQGLHPPGVPGAVLQRA